MNHNQKKIDREPDYINPQEYAYRHEISYDTALRLANAQKIKGAVKIGKQWRMPNNRKQNQ